MKALLVLLLIAMLAYAGTRDVYYFVLNAEMAAIPVYERMPDMVGLDGSAFECISRVEAWRKIGVDTARCEAIPMFRHLANKVIHEMN